MTDNFFNLRRWILCLAVLVTPFFSPTYLAAGPLQPSQWSNSATEGPQIEAWPNAVRVFGSDRYSTNRAVSLLGRGSGEFPFSEADVSSGGASNLSSANNWWGLNKCPKAVILVAADTPADALAAASLSDPTGLSGEPYLRRSAAASKRCSEPRRSRGVTRVPWL